MFKNVLIILILLYSGLVASLSAQEVQVDSIYASLKTEGENHLRRTRYQEAIKSFILALKSPRKPEDNLDSLIQVTIEKWINQLQRTQKSLITKQKELIASNEEKDRLYRKADTLRIIAEAEKERAEEKALVTYLLTAQSMAGKSQSIAIEEFPDSVKTTIAEKKLLGAQQAYIFNENYRLDRDGRMRGNEYDPNIYQALYQGIKAFEGKRYEQYLDIEGAVRSIVFAKDPAHFFVTGKEGQTHQFTFADLNQPPNPIDADKRSNRLLAQSASTETTPYLLVTKREGGLRLLKGDSLLREIDLGGQSARIIDASFVPNSKNFIVATTDGQIKYYDFTHSAASSWENQLEGRDIDRLDTQKDQLRRIAIHPNKSLLIGATKAGHLYIWDYEKDYLKDKKPAKKDLFLNASPSNPFHALVFSPDGQWLAAGNELGQVRVWNMQKDTLIYSLKGHDAGIESLSFSHADDSTLKLASGSRDHTARIWIFEPNQLNRFGHQPLMMKDKELDQPVTAVCFSPDGDYLITGYANGSIKRWPSSLKQMADIACRLIERKKLEIQEWNEYTGRDEQETDQDLAFRCTCVGEKPNMDKEIPCPDER